MNDASFSTYLAAGEYDAPDSPSGHTLPPRRPATAALDLALALLDRGKVALDERELRRLRHGRLMSQQDLADECWKRNIRVSIATIKRAESGRAVRFRIARELARCFGVPVEQILGIRHPTTP
ncbi:MAG: hypothetical protein AMXMBFR59_22440 [Rhodanobacteraceae bacterium]